MTAQSAQKVADHVGEVVNYADLGARKPKEVNEGLIGSACAKSAALLA
jgi:hypothetical protein